jgi:hypothetical protein
MKMSFFDKDSFTTNGILINFFGYLKPYTKDFGPDVNGINCSMVMASSATSNGVSISPLISRSAKLNGIQAALISGSTVRGNGFSTGLLFSRHSVFNGASFTGFYSMSMRKFNGLSVCAGVNDHTVFSGLVVSGVGIIITDSWMENLKGNLNGLGISLLFNRISSLHGVACSIFLNDIDNTNGLSVSLYNKTNALNGVQFGLVNYTRYGKGMQLGLINMDNSNGRFLKVLPLMNF